MISIRLNFGSRRSRLASLACLISNGMKRLKIIITLLFLSFLLLAPALAAVKDFIFPVPFTSQAPLAEWSDERQQDGCEEASAAMAMAGINKVASRTKKAWRTEILAISDFEKKQYGEYRDISLIDIKAWIFKGYYDYDRVAVKTVKSSSEILYALYYNKFNKI